MRRRYRNIRHDFGFSCLPSASQGLSLYLFWIESGEHIAICWDKVGILGSVSCQYYDIFVH